MNVRAMIMAVIAFGGCFVSLVRPYYGLLMLVVLYFFRPDLWGAEEIVRPVLWLTIAVTIGWLINTKGTELLKGNFWLIGLVALYVVATLAAPYSNQDSWSQLLQILKVFVAVYLISNICNTPERLSGLFLAILVGNLWFVKVAVLSWAAAGFSGNVRMDTGVGQGGGANYVAWVLASTIPFILYKVISGQGWQRAVAIAATPLWLAGIVATGSRGGLLCLVSGFAVLLFLVRRVKLLVVGAILLAALFWFAPAEYMERIETITLDPKKMDVSTLARYQNMQAGFKIMKDYPLFGTGLKTFPKIKSRYVSKDYVGQPYHVAHNTYIQIGSELGLVVLGYFLLLNVYVFRNLIRKTEANLDRETHDHLEWVRIGVLAALLSTLIQMMKGDVAHMDYLWWLYGIAIATLRVRSEAEATAAARLSEKKLDTKFAPAREKRKVK